MFMRHYISNMALIEKDGVIQFSKEKPKEQKKPMPINKEKKPEDHKQSLTTINKKDNKEQKPKAIDKKEIKETEQINDLLEKNTTIQVKTTTLNKLKKFGTKDETHDDVVNKMFRIIEENNLQHKLFGL